MIGRLKREPRANSSPARHPCQFGWRAAEYVVIDLETTGLDVSSDHIVSYGAVPVRNGRIVTSSSIYGLVHTERESSAAALRVHCIRKQDLAQAPSIDDCVRQLEKLTRGATVVAHGSWIEHSFLRRAFRASEYVFTNDIIDTAVLAHRLLDIDFEPGHTVGLEYAAKTMNLPVHTPHHALGDAFTTAHLFLALATKIELDEPSLTCGRLITLSS